MCEEDTEHNLKKLFYYNEPSVQWNGLMYVKGSLWSHRCQPNIFILLVYLQIVYHKGKNINVMLRRNKDHVLQITERTYFESVRHLDTTNKVWTRTI